MSIVSLITDFGTQDEYVGLMKAVILGIAPTAVPVDVSHAVDPQDVAQAAFLVAAAHAHFPDGSVHLVVVDPGVGGARDILVLERGAHRFVAPDNGVLTLVLEGAPVRVRRLENPRWRRTVVSPTFHGRDIMAPAAALLARGADPADAGPEIPADAAVRLTDLRARRTPTGIEGRVVHVDRFGNLVTNIQGDMLPGGAQPVIGAGRADIRGVSRTYSDGAPGDLLALVGSRGTVEIAVNGGSAAKALGVGKGAPVAVRWV